MNAFAMPISSRTAADMDWLCFWANSPRILEERSATCWKTLASSWLSFWLTAGCFGGCIPHDAICTCGTLFFTRVVEIMQVSYRLAHCEEPFVRIKRPPGEKREKIAPPAPAVFQP